MGADRRAPGRARRRRASLIVLAAAVALLATAAATAQAYNIEQGIRRWPGTTITYYPSAYKKAVDRGAKAWNDANVGVKFKRVSSRSKANVIVSYGQGVNACEGLSYVGYPGRNQQGWVELGRNCDREFMIFTATHELGHSLGLGHEKHKCARMNPSADFPTGTPRPKCNYHSRSYWLNHLLKADDINGARALYGG